VNELIAIRTPVSNFYVCDPKMYVIRDPAART